MAFKRSRHRSSRPGIGSYATRLLLGYVGSLSILLVILYLSPVSSSTADWLLPSSHSGHLVYEVQESSSDESESSDGTERASTPVARDVPPGPQQPMRRSGHQRKGASDKGAPDDSAGGARDIPEVTSLTNVEQPQIVGGRGSYYLQIRYPEAARREGIEGRLRLRFVVTEDGSPEHIEVVEPLHPLTDTAAVRALRSVDFRPARHEGDSVAVWMSLPVRFRLIDTTATETARAHPTSLR